MIQNQARNYELLAASRENPCCLSPTRATSTFTEFRKRAASANSCRRLTFK
jgi:hypothetical protein